MQWSEISFITTHEAAELVAEIFHDIGTSGVVIEDPDIVNDYIRAGLWDYTDMSEVDDTECVTVKAYLPLDDGLENKMRQFQQGICLLKERQVDIGQGKLYTRQLRDEDWANNWKQYFHVDKIGKIVIKPSWEEYQPYPDDLVIEIDPGEAFGTGTHDTTSMCICELLALVEPGMKVFDIGTGSGILYLAAAKLGAGDITAVDYDNVAVRVASENIQANGYNDLIHIRQSDLFSTITGRADLIIANIIADLVIALFEELPKHLNPGGVFLASGIISDRIADVEKAAQEHGFKVIKLIQQGGWAAMRIAYNPS